MPLSLVEAYNGVSLVTVDVTEDYSIYSIDISTASDQITSIWMQETWHDVPETATIAYLPHHLGLRWDLTNINAPGQGWSWQGDDSADQRYPGHWVAPLVVASFENKAVLLCVLDHDPTRIMWCGNGIALLKEFSPALALGDPSIIRFLRLVDEDPATSERDRVARLMLNAGDILREQNFFPPPAWEPHKLSEGTMSINLQNFEDWVDALLSKISDMKPYITDVTLWGQMSNYLGSCCSGIQIVHERYRCSCPEEVEGCCSRSEAEIRKTIESGAEFGENSVPWIQESTRNPAYDGIAFKSLCSRMLKAAPHLRTFIRCLKHDLGLTFRAYTLPADDRDDSLFLKRWSQTLTRIDGEHALDANAYADTVSAMLATSRDISLINSLDDNTMIEGSTVWSRHAALVSNALTGGGVAKIGGGTTLMTDPNGLPRGNSAEPWVTSAPWYLRCLMPDRPMYLGFQNSDANWWKPDFDGFLYPGERGVFRYGFKPAPIELGYYFSDADSIWQDIITERRRVNFWAQNPKYADMQGITYVPDDVYVSRFNCDNGVTLLAIDSMDTDGVIYPPIVVDGTSISEVSRTLELVTL